MNRLNYNHLYYFRTIAREGSIKRACQRLHLTQPTLSDQLKNLEEFLGVQLFERRNRQLFLTPSGETALQYADRIFSLGNEFVQVIARGEKVLAKTVRVGIVPSLSRAFTYRTLIPAFESQDVHIRVKEAELKYLLLELEDGQIDFILCDDYDSMRVSKYKSIDVGTSRYYAVSGKRYAEAAKGFPQSLATIPFFNYTSDSRIRHEIDHFFSNNEIHPRPIGEADDINFLRIITEKDQCFSILPGKTVRASVRKKRLYVLGEMKTLKTRVSLVYNPESSNQAAKSLIAAIRQAGLDEDSSLATATV